MTAEEVRALRKSLGATQGDLAKAVGVRRATVSDWETGKSEPFGAALKMLGIVSRIAESVPSSYDIVEKGGETYGRITNERGDPFAIVSTAPGPRAHEKVEAFIKERRLDAVEEATAL